MALNPDDYPDFESALDIIWNSARFPDRFFWAEISITKRREKLIAASISAIAQSEEDLPQNLEDESPDTDS